MKKLYYYFYCDNDEYDVFLDEKLKVVWWWHCNNASYRDEYMAGLFMLCGTKIERLPEKLEKKAKKAFEAKL